MNFLTGEILAVNKPYHWTSFQVVNKLKWAIRKHLSENEGIISNKSEGISNKGALPKLKIGHAGTLDPLATGLLLICTGKKTKEIYLLQEMEKEYTGTFLLGATTPCFDLEKEVDFTFPTEHITEEMVLNAAKKFVGVQQQTPPNFSAVHVQGKRAYDLARAGESFELPPKQITIKEFEITACTLPQVQFRIVCSKGTYIRSIARDFGLALSSGAHLTALHRSKIGHFSSKEAHNLEALVAQLVNIS